MNSSKLKYSYNGEEKTLKEWAKATGISYNALYTRLKRGMSEEEAFTLPARKTHKTGGNYCRLRKENFRIPKG